VLDDIVSELWRKENVTSGYCPRYRYTLIATLTLANLYYICVDFLPTHTIGESVLPAHFLRVIRRSFMWIVFRGSFFMWIVRSVVVRGRASIRSLGHSFVRSRSLGHSFVGVIRWVIRCAVIRWVILCWVIPLVGVFVGLFRWLLWASLPFVSFSCGLFVSRGFEVRTLGGEFLKGIFAL
jgi:hypothetical protein